MKLSTLKTNDDGKSAFPRYLRYAMLLEEWMRLQKPEPGSRFPGDKLLSKHFGTTPVTISRSINELVRKGLLERRIGSGTYVTGKSSPESKRIGLFCHEVIIPDSAYITPFLNTFYDFWAAVGYQVVSLKCNPNEYEKLMRDYELAGALILVPSQEILRDSRELAKAGLPLVSVGYADPESTGFSFGTDHMNAGKSVVKYLYNLGHRRIAIVSQTNFSGSMRSKGYQEAMWELGLPVNPAWNFDNHLFRFTEIMKSAAPPTALILTHNSLSIMVYDLVARSGTKIPQDLSVITFDDSEFIRTLNPPLAVCTQNIPGFTKCASRTLLAKIRHKQPEAVEYVPEPIEIIRRDSLKQINIQGSET